MSNATEPRISAGPRIVLAIVLVCIWLAVSAVGGPAFGKIGDVSSNDQGAFLPANAESTRAGQWTQKFTGGDHIPAIIVGEGGPELVGAAEAVARRVREVDGVDQVIGPIPSDDAEAAQLIAIVSTADRDAVSVVDDVRVQLDGAGFLVTGPAGFVTDLRAAFAGIDGLLLGVALVAVFVILVIVYRSVLLPIVVLLTAMVALTAAILVVYHMAKSQWIQLNGQSQGILSILVIGAATDYSLLLVARYREELHSYDDRWDALKVAWRASWPAITASAATVAVALLCLLVSDLNSNRSLGPIAASGIFFAWLAALTFLPSVLFVGTRGLFWPAIPHAHGANVSNHANNHQFWRRVAGFVERNHRKVFGVTLGVLVLAAIPIGQFRASGVAQSDLLLANSEARDGQVMLGKHFSAGAGSPVNVIAPDDKADSVLERVIATDGISGAYVTGENGQPAFGPMAKREVVDEHVWIQATLAYAPDSADAEAVVRALRESFDGSTTKVLIGGSTATQIDSNATGVRDLRVIIPLVLIAVFGILVVLLRSIVAPAILVVATVLSFASTMGVSAILFNDVLGFSGADPAVPLYGFVFLVALGVDYTIFLMTRAREEAETDGTRRGLLSALVTTGGVITSAGVVLAATFAALVVIPLMFMVQLAFIVAFGVLVDTFVVRTLLVPSVTLELGETMWWPWQPTRSGVDRESDEGRVPLNVGIKGR